jgi:hypothetical protein
MTVRLGISVEGQTEERFVKDVLAPHLWEFDVFAEPKIVATGWTADGRRAKGGGINVGRVTKELGILLPSFRDGYVTSLYDLYGFEDRNPGESADALQLRLARELGAPRNLITYIQRHEFEALLLADPAVAATYFLAPKMEKPMRQEIAAAGSAEDVNDGSETAPSKRLERWTVEHAPPLMRFSDRTKVRHGAVLSALLTIPVIRAACPRFNDWLTRLEGLGGSRT